MSTNNYTTIRNFIISLLTAYRRQRLVPFPASGCRRCGGWGHVYEKHGNIIYSLRCPVCNRKRTWLLFCCLTCLLLSACKPGEYTFLANHDTPEQIAKAAKVQAEADALKEQNDYNAGLHTLDLDAKRNSAALQQKAAAQAIEDDSNTRQMRASTEQAFWTGIGNALPIILKTIGEAIAGTIYILSLALAIRIVLALWAQGRRTYAEPPHYMLEAHIGDMTLTYILMRDQLNSPAIIQDPLSGRRAKINDYADVETLRASLLQVTQPAQMLLGPGQPRPQQDGLLRRIWIALFGRSQAKVRKTEVIL